MKKTIITFLAFFLCLSGYSQSLTQGSTFSIPEPEFVNSYVHVMSNENFTILPKEHGEFKKHESKWSKIAKAGSVVASVGVAVGGATIGLGNSAETVIGGLRTVGVASEVGNVANTVDVLAGFEGMDIVFKGKSSTYVVPGGKELNILYRSSSNENDPQDMIRFVKFNSSSKERKIRWLNYSSSLLNTEEATKNGFLPFSAKKYGKSSYLITIPANIIEKGEYGIVVGTSAVSTVIPIATFSVQ